MLIQPAMALARSLPALALLLTLSACSTLRVGSDYDRSADFSAYHTFLWMPRAQYGTRNPLVAARARDAIQTELLQKGFVYTSNPAAADFIVDFTIGAHERTDIESYPAPYAGPWYGNYPNWWGGPYWGNSIDVHQYREGTLAIDVFDAHTDKPVWHGWAKKELTQADLDHSEEPIRRAAQAVLAQFPPR